jgi:N-glycosylase/DNA lyase
MPSPSGVVRPRLPLELLSCYKEQLEEYKRKVGWEELAEEELWGELCFCILSSNVPYEMASSAYVQLFRRGLLEVENLGRNGSRAIWRELSRPVYYPERNDGSFRVYRFPHRRAADITRAWHYFYKQNSGLASLLKRADSPTVLRSRLVADVPGLGFKEASHFLRNVKYTDCIAVLDSHVVSFLKSYVRSTIRFQTLTPRRYLELEATFVNFAREASLRPAILDLAVWEYMRFS